MFSKKLLLSIAIMLVFVFFVGYGIEVFYPSPEYQDTCREDLHTIENQAECISQSGEWNQGMPSPEGSYDKGMCQPSKECYSQFDILREKHDRVIFIISIIVGIIAIISGFMIQKDAVGSGLIGGSILLILYGTMRYWEHANSILKFVLLGFALGILIWLGYRKIK